MLKYLIFIICMFSMVWGYGQLPADSVAAQNVPLPTDSAAMVTTGLPDSLLFSRRDPVLASRYAPGPEAGLLLKGHPFFSFTQPGKYTVTPRKWQGKEAIFYSLVGLLLFFAIIRNSFYRYVQDLFKTYFQTTVKQRQIKDQLLQSPLPSLLFNVFFTLSIGMFLALVLQYFGLGTGINFWLLYLYCILGLITVYGIKYITLKLLGWLFQVPDATESYIFVVFTTNKIIGMVLIPFIVLLAFSFGDVKQAVVTLSIAVIIGLLVYRFFLSYTSIKTKIRISFFHFIIYLLAFEIAPLLLINKLLFRFLGETP